MREDCVQQETFCGYNQMSRREAVVSVPNVQLAQPRYTIRQVGIRLQGGHPRGLTVPPGLHLADHVLSGPVICPPQGSEGQRR